MGGVHANPRIRFGVVDCRAGGNGWKDKSMASRRGLIKLFAALIAWRLAPRNSGGKSGTIEIKGWILRRDDLI